MAAAINFYADTEHVKHLSGSGIGFFGPGGFGDSVAVGEYQDSTVITNGAGTIEAATVNNIKYVHDSSGNINGTGPEALTSIPNRLTTLNIRFTNDTAVTTQNAELRIFDRDDINNDPSGVTVRVAEIIHPDEVTQTGGSGDTTWIQAHGSGVTVDFVDSPGMSGINAMGSNSADRHDFYAALSASADSIGSKTNFGLYFTLEYL